MTTPETGSPGERSAPAAAAGDGPVTPGDQAPAPRSRAGRNLPAAIAVGVSLGAVVVASLLLYRPAFVVVVALAVVVGVWELIRALDQRPSARTDRTGGGDARQPVVPLLAGSLAMIALAHFRGPDGLVVGFMITVLACLIWRLADGADGYLHDVGSTVFIVTYVPLLAGFAVLLAGPEDGAWRVVAFILTVVCSDTGGYIAGVLAGRHPMAPTVSPKKSWEGFVGSLLACALAGALLLTLALPGQWWQGALFGVAIAVTATVGDLGESMVKRDLAIKDMGHLLPGHGGLMDRLDSLLPSAAVAWILLTAIVPPA